jgi:hypothetical protein
MSLPIGRRAFWSIVFEFYCRDDVSGLGIERGQRADRAAVIGENDFVVRSSYMMPSSPPWLTLILLISDRLLRSNIGTVESPLLV